MPKNWKGDTLGFLTSILSQNIKKLNCENFLIYEKKSHNAEKNWNGDSVGFFNIHSVAKHQKK